MHIMIGPKLDAYPTMNIHFKALNLSAYPLMDTNCDAFNLSAHQNWTFD
jgi:hypothetical protein